jgi:hypothetical protein
MPTSAKAPRSASMGVDSLRAGGGAFSRATVASAAAAPTPSAAAARGVNGIVVCSFGSTSFATVGTVRSSSAGSACAAAAVASGTVASWADPRSAGPAVGATVGA